MNVGAKAVFSSDDEEVSVSNPEARSLMYTLSCHEMKAVIDEIEDRVGPKSLVIIAVVSSDSIMRFRQRLTEYNNGLHLRSLRRFLNSMQISAGSVFIETEESCPSRVTALARSRHCKRLSLIISPVFETSLVRIPAYFTKLEVVAREKEKKMRNKGSAQQVKEL